VHQFDNLPSDLLKLSQIPH